MSDFVCNGMFDEVRYDVIST